MKKGDKKAPGRRARTGAGGHARRQTGRATRLNPQRTRAEEALRTGEGRFRTLAEAAPIGIFLTKPTGECIYTNPVWAAISGLSFEESLGYGWTRAIHPDDQAKVKESWLAAVGRGENYGTDYRLITPAGEVRWVHGLATPQLDASGTVVCYVGSVEDITERWQAEAVHRRLTAILEATTDFVALADAQGRRLYLNRAGRRMVGIREDEDVSGITIAAAHPEWARDRILTEALPTAIRDGVWSGESALLTRKGREIPVSQVILAHRAPDGTVEFFSTIARDISERKRTEMHLEAMVEDRTRQLQRALSQSEEASRHKSEFLRNMSHELRTPLNAVIGFAELLVDQHMGALNTKQTRYVEHIHQSGKHLLQIINDILDLTKVEAGKLELKPEAFSLRDALTEALEEIRPQAEVKKVALHLLEGEDGGPLVADRLRVRQILDNLLNNAVKFTPSGGSVTLSTRRGGASGESVEISVADTGIGIKAEDFGKLFQEFTQLDASIAKRHQGTGLGLALVKRLVELHGGEIRVESPGEGRGSTFTVLLPLRPPRSRERILVFIEEDKALSALVAEALQNAGFDVEGRGESEDALARSHEAPPALVIVDLVGGEGGELLRRLREGGLPRRLPVIVLTGSEADRVDQAIALGADEFLVKPFSPSVLLDAVERLLRSGVGSGGPRSPDWS